MHSGRDPASIDMADRATRSNVDSSGAAEMACPVCGSELVTTQTARGMVFVCRTCGGRALAVSVLRRVLGRSAVRRLWSQAKTISLGRGKKCPACSRAMCDVVAGPEQGGIRLDVCTRCPLVWFDSREFKEPATASKLKEKELPLEAREAIALAELRLDEQRRRGPDFGGEDAPEESWKWIPGYFGLPLEEEDPGFELWPFVTWGLAAALVLTFAFTGADFAGAVQQYGLIPADPWRHGGLTLLSSFFIHAGLLHLAGNVYFLVLCGDDVEDDLGHWRYAIVVLVAALAGNAAHIALDTRPNLPCVGASGGIAAVLTYYALQFPRVRLLFMARYSWFPIGWYYLPAYAALVAWLILQVATAILQTHGLGHISGLAHLGGASVGAAAWAWRRMMAPGTATD